VKGLAVGLYFIPGMMVGVEIQAHPDTGNNVFILDLFIVRLMFEVLTEEE
jgi:hypothetical protein